MVILFKDLTSKGQVSCYNNKVPKRVQSFSAGSLHSAKKKKNPWSQWRQHIQYKNRSKGLCPQ